MRKQKRGKRKVGGQQVYVHRRCLPLLRLLKINKPSGDLLFVLFFFSFCSIVSFIYSEFSSLFFLFYFVFLFFILPPLSANLFFSFCSMKFVFSLFIFSYLHLLLSNLFIYLFISIFRTSLFYFLLAAYFAL